MRSMRTVWIVGPLAALTLLYSAPAGKAQQEQSLTGLEDVFAPGVFLEDRNGDGVVDFIHARIVLPADPAPEEVAAAANIAGRLGFESSRLPYLWQLRSDTISSVMDDVEEFLGESRVDVNGVRATEAVYEDGREQVSRLVMALDVLDPGNAAELLDELAADHRVGQARFTDRRAVRLSY